jgi:hypothetical protein
MRESIQEIITRLLRYKRAPTKMTREFREWKHNRDILPKLQEQLEMILDAYGKYQPVVYDTQGFRDDGSDIVLRHREGNNEDSELKLIAFQVKSFDDLCKKSYMQELKAQHDDTTRKVIGLQYYFIMLCTDAEAHKELIRKIAAEFRSAKKTEIIDPEFSFTFLHHKASRVNALVKRTLEAEDLVFKRALELLEIPSPSARGLAIFIAVQYAAHGKTTFEYKALKSNPVLRDIYDEFMNREALEEEEVINASGSESQIAQDLSHLETDLIDLDSTSENVVVRTKDMLPLSAVIIDALVRYDYNAEDVLPYMLSLFGVMD